MLQGLDELEFPLRGPFDDLTDLSGCFLANEVQADPALRVFQLDMGGEPVLIAGTFIQQLIEGEVADLAMSLRGSDAGLLHRLAEHLRGSAIDPTLWICLQALTAAMHDRGHDPGSLGPVA